MRIKLFLLIPLLVSFIFCTGCWDYREYEDMVLVSALGVDFNKDTREITVTIQYMVPGALGGAQGKEGSSKSSLSSGTIETASGITMADAFTNIQKVVGRKLFYGYMQVQVVGEDAAKYIMKDIIQIDDRTPEIRTTAYLAIAPGKAKDAVSTFDPDASEQTGKNIYDLINQSVSSGSSLPISIEDFEEKMALEGTEPVATRIEERFFNKPNGGSETSGNMDSGNKGEQKTGHQRIEGLAVFRGEELVGWLDSKESLGLGWITRKNMAPYEIVKISDKEDTESRLIFRVSKSNSKIKVQLDNGKPVININTYVEADMRKYTDDIMPETLTPDTISLVEERLSENVQLEINAAIKKGQKELKSDIFGFGYVFYRQRPGLWHSQYEKKWQDIFVDMPVKVNVEAKVINTGTNIMKFFVR